MSYEIPGFTRSYEAVADLSASWFQFVKLSGATVAAVSAITDNAVGVLQNQPLKAAVGVYKGGENNAASVMVDGVSRVKTGAAVAAGVPVTIDSVGRVVAATSGQKVVGVTETASTAINQVVSVLLKPLGGIVVP